MSGAELASLHDAPPARVDQRIKVELFLDMHADLAEGDGREEVEDAVETALRIWSERYRGSVLTTGRRAITLRVVDARMGAEGLADLEIEEV